METQINSDVAKQTYLEIEEIHRIKKGEVIGGVMAFSGCATLFAAILLDIPLAWSVGLVIFGLALILTGLYVTGK